MTISPIAPLARLGRLGRTAAVAVCAGLLLAPAGAAPRDETQPEPPKAQKLEDVFVPIPSYSPDVGDNGCSLRDSPQAKPVLAPGQRAIPFWVLVQETYGRYSVQLTSSKGGRDVFLRRITEAGLSPDARTAVILYALRDHLGRDGLHTHFLMSGGALAPEIRDALKAAGMQREHDIYAAAMAAFGAEYPVESEVREKHFGYHGGSELNAFDHKLLAIVQAFLDDDALAKKIEAFIESRAEVWRGIEARRKTLGELRRVDVLTRALWEEVGKFEIEEISAATLPRLTPEERALLAVDLFNMEFENGGVHQFFYNSSGNFAPDVAAALEVIGLPRQAALVRTGMALFKAPYPRDRELRAKSYIGKKNDVGFEQQLSDLTDAFYALDGGPVVTHLGKSTQIEGGPGIRDGMKRYAVARRLLPC